MKHIFISYSRADVQLMREIRTHLESKQLKTWTDENLQPGTRAWKLAIEQALDNAGALVAILSPDAKASEWVDREIEYARVHNVPIIPLLAVGTPVQSVPLELINAQWIDISTDTTYSDGIDQLVLALDTKLGVKRKSRDDLILEQFAMIADRIATTYLLYITDVDGRALASYIVPDVDNEGIEIKEAQFAAMAATMVGLGERLLNRADASDFRFGVESGTTGTLFHVGLGNRLTLTFGVRDVKSIDATLVILQQWWGRLLEILEIEPPII